MSSTLTDFFKYLDPGTGPLTTFFNGIQQGVSTIVSTAQGIASGLVSLAAGIWDSIIKFGQSIANGIYGALQWIYNGAKYVIDNIISILQHVFDFFVGLINQFWDFLNGFFSSLAGSVNDYFSGIVGTWRNKVKQMIIVDLAITGGYPALQKLPERFMTIFEEKDSKKDVFKSIIGSFAAPFIGAISGAVFGELIDVLLPSGTANVQLIPTHKVPAMTVARMPVVNVMQPVFPVPPSPVITTNNVNQATTTTLSGALTFNVTRPVLRIRVGHLGGDISLTVVSLNLVHNTLGGALNAQVHAGLGEIYATLAG